MKLLCLVAVSVLVSGCAAASYQMGAAPGGHPMQRPMHPQPVPFQAGQSPIGRWDNVMMLVRHSVVEVLTADGAVMRGLVAGVSTGSLRVRGDFGDRNLPATDVMRVDRLEGVAPGRVRDGVWGAAWGVSVVAFVGLVLRRMPPPQWLAAAAWVGANLNYQAGRTAPGRVTIYLSPSVASGAPPRIQ